MARDYGVESRVIMGFTIHSDGRMGDIELLRELGLGDAIAAALKEMPDWRPARMRGEEAVATRYVLPLSLYQDH